MGLTEEQTERVNDVVGALIRSTPEKFKSIDCTVTQVDNQCLGRYSYSVSCAEFPDEEITEPTDDLHQTVYEALRALGAVGLEINMAEAEEGWQFSIHMTYLPGDDLEQAKEARAAADEQLWQRVYDERTAFFEECFGPLPGDINKVMTVHWTGGGLYDIEKPAKIPGARVLLTFGLSNPDMPSPVKVTEFKREDKPDGPTYSSVLVHKVPRYVPPEWAGLGYEVAIVLADPSERRAMGVLMWLIENEINDDMDFFGIMTRHNGLTVQDIQLFDGSQYDFLFYPSVVNWPAELDLSNGLMHLVIGTRITREERDFARDNSCAQLVERLKDAGVNQVTDFQRKSVV